MFNFDKKTTIALINGKQFLYDACSTERDDYKDTENNYIGEGTIYSIDGVLQTTARGEKMYHFFKWSTS